MSIIAQSISSIGLPQGPKAVSSFGYRPNEQSGRSGYWRLFYIKLQEESLRKDEYKEEKKQETPQELKPRIIYERKKVTKQKVVKENSKTTERTPWIKPLVQQETGVSGLAKIWTVSTEISTLLAQYGARVIKYAQQPDVIVDDEEDDIELLLLAA